MHPRAWQRRLVSTGLGLGLGLVVVPSPAQERTATPKKPAPVLTDKATPLVSAKSRVPAWAHDARWYHVVVPRFSNVEPSNDPADVSNGGDLQGLQSRFSYLKDLGFNALFLSSVFRTAVTDKSGETGLRHIDDAVAIKGSLAKVVGETDDPATWKFSASDQLFLGLLEKAHERGFHIMLEMPPTKNVNERETLSKLARRWIDPNGDGKPEDGIDGWLVRNPEKLPHDFWKRWRKHTKKGNSNALLVADVGGDPRPWLAGDQFDLAVDHGTAEAIRRFLGKDDATYTLERFLRDLEAGARHRPVDSRMYAPIPLSTPKEGRALSALSFRPATDAGKPGGATPVGDAQVGAPRWRLATVMQYFLPGTPMVFYGDEVGMYNTKGHHGLAPVWRKDGSGAVLKTGPYREDFAALIKWLNTRRGVHPPLRRGDFRGVLQDKERRIFAFSRKLPGDEVILVVNYGHTKQKVLVPAGEPGQLVGVLAPQLDPSALGPLRKVPPVPSKGVIKPIRMGGSRQYVDAGGQVRVWVNPMSIRVVLVRDNAPWSNNNARDSKRERNRP